MNLHDPVQLVSELPEQGLPAGSIGAIVHIHMMPGPAYEVEFVDNDGRTSTLALLEREELRALDSGYGSLR